MFVASLQAVYSSLAENGIIADLGLTVAEVKYSCLSTQTYTDLES